MVKHCFVQDYAPEFPLFIASRFPSLRYDPDLPFFAFLFILTLLIRDSFDPRSPLLMTIHYTYPLSFLLDRTRMCLSYFCNHLFSF